jgi:hypothetical protein
MRLCERRTSTGLRNSYLATVENSSRNQPSDLTGLGIAGYDRIRPPGAPVPGMPPRILTPRWLTLLTLQFRPI